MTHPTTLTSAIKRDAFLGALREYLLLTILPGLLCIVAGGWVG